MKSPILLLTAAILAAGLAPPAHAYLARGEIRLQIDVIRQNQDNRLERLCAAELQFGPDAAQHTAVIQLNSDALQPEASPSSDSRMSCVVAGVEDSGSVSAPGAAASGRVGSVRLNAHILRQMEDERSLVLRLAIEPTQLNADGPDSSAHPGPGLVRQLQFDDDAVAYVPLPGWDAASDAPQAGLLLRLQSRLEPADNHSKFGALLIRSAQIGATVRMDGGQVGRIPAGGQLRLQFVTPGPRRVTLRYPSGTEGTQFATVQPGRTKILSFADGGKEDRKGNLFALKPTGENEQGFREFLRARDHAVMTEIPEGEFLMGNQRTERTPFEHLVYLSTFLIDKTTVTWRQYQAFLSDTGTPFPPHDPYWGIQDEHPAVYVSWHDARAYCQWVGGRLPTEAEREKAARGTDRRMYPWGEEPPTPDRAVFRRSWGNPATDPVGIRPQGASPYGVLDMGGNVWEWCSDWYSDDYLEASPYENPSGPETGTRRVLRGGSWDSRPDVLSASCRNFGHPGYREGDFGFRCAMDAIR
jgi:formylglycine-generating enzyme required for sulfatase activity